MFPKEVESAESGWRRVYEGREYFIDSNAATDRHGWWNVWRLDYEGEHIPFNSFLKAVQWVKETERGKDEKNQVS